jgi:hypothetical protein
LPDVMKPGQEASGQDSANAWSVINLSNPSSQHLRTFAVVHFVFLVATFHLFIFAPQEKSSKEMQ